MVKDTYACSFSGILKTVSNVPMSAAPIMDHDVMFTLFFGVYSFLAHFWTVTITVEGRG
jgi:hypothetical protein